MGFSVAFAALACLVHSAFALRGLHQPLSRAMRPALLVSYRGERWGSSRRWAVKDSEEESIGEVQQLLRGVRGVTGADLQLEALRELGPEDFLTVLGLAPMVYTSITTSLGGTFDNNLYLTCAVSALLTAFAHFSLYQKTPRDFRSPRLGEENTIYELSTIYLLPFSWLLFRINPLFPETLAAADIPMAALLTAVVVYGCAGAVVGKYFLPSADGSRPLASFLQPADAAYVRQCQLLLSGNAAINVLALLFVPFTWTLVIRGTEWWARVCSLHPNQAAFLGLSVLAAIVGDSSGVVALRLLRKDVITSTAAVVVLGLVSNALLLIVPEVVFRIFYAQGVSELNFYWQ